MSSGHIIDSEMHESPNQNRGEQFTLESMYVLQGIAETWSKNRVDDLHIQVKQKVWFIWSHSLQATSSDTTRQRSGQTISRSQLETRLTVQVYTCSYKVVNGSEMYLKVLTGS
jgi:hypothetical protein